VGCTADISEGHTASIIRADQYKPKISISFNNQKSEGFKIKDKIIYDKIYK
jgi:hypothetical protein